MQRERWDQEGTPDGNVPGGGLARMLELDGRFCPVPVNALHELAQPGNKAIVRDADLAGYGHSMGMGDRRHADDDEACPSPCARLVVASHTLAHPAVLFTEIGPHGSHHDPVSRLEPTDAAWRQQCARC
jgi:hypothetical protein